MLALGTLASSQEAVDVGKDAGYEWATEYTYLEKCAFVLGFMSGAGYCGSAYSAKYNYYYVDGSVTYVPVYQLVEEQGLYHLSQVRLVEIINEIYSHKEMMGEYLEDVIWNWKDYLRKVRK